MAVTAIQEWLQAGHTNPSNTVQRQVLVISGCAEDCYQRAEILLSTLSPALSSCWVGPGHSGATRQVDIRHARQLLGQEFDVAVYDAHQPFRPSAFMAVAGTLKQGGRLILLTPDLAKWHLTTAVLDTHFVSFGYKLKTSPYLKRLQALLVAPRYRDTIAHWQRHSVHLPLAFGVQHTPDIPAPFVTEDQASVFTRAKQHLDLSNACVVITAPRGRGKSALLGLLAADLIGQGENVTLTSPVSNNTQTIFDIAQQQSAGQRSGRRSPKLTSSMGPGSLQWCAPDHPQLSSHQHRYLIVDEAASLPLPVLKGLVTSAERIVVATTTDGYEGSGQGFLSRFIPFLEHLKRLTHFTLTTPIRWLNDDPLEQFSKEALLVAADVNWSISRTTNEDTTWSTETFDSLSERHFHEAIQLLVSAHYQTTPDDIMRIVDAPDTFLVVATSVDTIVAVCIVTKEGGEPLLPVASEISQGKRRVKGHLGAQRLSLLTGIATFASLNYWRINRIAVTPSRQGQGIGSACLHYLTEKARHAGIDALSSSFGATSRLLNFWRLNRFEQIAAGHKPDKSSGERSALVLKPLTQNLTKHISKFKRLFLYDTAQLDIALLLSPTTTEDSFCFEVIIKRLEHFSQGSRSFDQLGAAWTYFLEKAGHRLEGAVSIDMHIQEITQVLQLRGKKEATQILRRAVKEYLA